MMLDLLTQQSEVSTCPNCLKSLSGSLDKAPVRSRVLCNTDYGQHVVFNGVHYMIDMVCLPVDI